MKNKILPINSIFIRSSGYYDVNGLYKVLKEINIEQVHKEWIETNSRHDSSNFISWLETNKFIEPIEYLVMTSCDYNGYEGLEII